MIKTLVFLLEELSAKEMLLGVLDRVLPPTITPEFMVFSGKQDLEKCLVRRMRGWQKPGSAFVILRDQDAGECAAIKQKLTALCQQTGKPLFLVRIACHELESFYLGDLQAVEKGLELGGIAKQQKHSKFRAPDGLGNPSEELAKLTEGVYQKVSGSRAIGPYLDLTGNCSNSFNVLLAGIRQLVSCTPKSVP